MAKFSIKGGDTQSKSTAGTYIYRVSTLSNTTEPLTLNELDDLAREKNVTTTDLSADERNTVRRTERINSVVFRIYFLTQELSVVLEDLPFYNAVISGRLYERDFSIDKSSMTKDDIVDVFATQYN